MMRDTAYANHKQKVKCQDACLLEKMIQRVYDKSNIPTAKWYNIFNTKINNITTLIDMQHALDKKRSYFINAVYDVGGGSISPADSACLGLAFAAEFDQSDDDAKPLSVMMYNITCAAIDAGLVDSKWRPDDETSYTFAC